MKILRNLLGIGKLTKEERKLLKELQEYDLSLRLHNYYIHNVRFNENDSYALSKLKIIRNIVLGKEAPPDRKNPNKRTFYYGNLVIQVNDKEKAIVWMQNCKGKYDFNIDIDKKKYIEKVLKIG